MSSEKLDIIKQEKIGKLVETAEMNVDAILASNGIVANMKEQKKRVPIISNCAACDVSED